MQSLKLRVEIDSLKNIFSFLKKIWKHVCYFNDDWQREMALFRVLYGFKSETRFHCLQCNHLQRYQELNGKLSLKQQNVYEESQSICVLHRSYKPMHLTLFMLKSLLSHPHCSGLIMATYTDQETILPPSQASPGPMPTVSGCHQVRLSPPEL